MADNRSQFREICVSYPAEWCCTNSPPLSADFKTGVVSRAAGSCYAENAGTKVTVAVYGPRQMPTSEFCALGKLKCDFKVMPGASQLASTTAISLADNPFRGSDSTFPVDRGGGGP